MSQSVINIRMDDELKKNFENICSELGMNMSTAITIFAKKMVRENRVPFDVSVDPFYSETNAAALKSSLEQLKSGKTVEVTLSELEKYE